MGEFEPQFCNSKCRKAVRNVARSVCKFSVYGDVLRANCGEQKQDGKSLQAGHSLNLDRLKYGGRRTMLAVFESRKEMPVPAVQLNCLES
jgi:hypothetical protein